MQPVYDRMDGVISTEVGYSGGDLKDPTYEQIAYGETGHREVILVEFNPEIVTYEEILLAFWQSIEPTQSDGQFHDRGDVYRTAIYYSSPEQHKTAKKSLRDLEQSGKFNEPIATEILPAKPFYPAEEGHQRYYEKNPGHYSMYSEGSGRAPFLRKTWRSISTPCLENQDTAPERGEKEKKLA